MAERARALLRSLAEDAAERTPTRANLDAAARALAQATDSAHVEIAVARITDEYEVVATHPPRSGTGRHLPAIVAEAEGLVHRDPDGRPRARLLWDGARTPPDDVVEGVVERVLAIDADLRLQHAVELAESGRTRVRRAIAQHDPAAVVTAAAGALREHLDADLVYVRTSEPELAAVRGSDPDRTESHPELEAMAGLALRVARTCWEDGRAFVLSEERTVPTDVTAERRSTVLGLLRGIGLDAMLLVPIGRGGRCVGCVVLLRGSGRPEWSEVEIRTALELGRDVGAALHLAGLFDTERRQSRERERIVSTMAHELKTPLTAVLGYVELTAELAADAPPALAAALAAPLAGLSEAGQRIEGIVADLLLLSRSTSAAPLTRERTDLVACARTAVERLAEPAAAGDVAITTVLPDHPVPVRAERAALARIVGNLVDNAVRFGDPGHRVEVRVEQTASAAGSPVLLRVADTGWGVTPEDQARLFTAFGRADDPRVRARPGAGLGLATVARLVERLDGRVSLRSRAGEGTVVEVYLPAGAPEAPR